MSSDLINRFHSHNVFAKKGFTINYRPWIVVYVEFCENKKSALICEKQLKSSRGRRFINEEIISNY